MKMIFKVILCIIAVYAFTAALLYFTQRSAMYIPTSTKPDAKAQGVPLLTEINVTTEDGLKLYGWHKPSVNPQAPTIVYFHGNASNVAVTTARAMPYMIKGYGLLAVEYRGYAGNPGAPTEQGLYKDGRAFIEWLKTKGTDTSKMIFYGESIGSGPAVQMATEYAAQTLVLDSAFSSAVDAAAFHYPYFPVKWLLKDRYENISKIEKIQSPLIMVHGDRDSIIPYKLGKRLFEKAPEPKTLITVEGGYHNNLDQFKAYEKILSALSE